MSSSDVSAVTNHFAPANEGFSTVTSILTTSGGNSVGLLSTTNLVNAAIFVGVIEPGTAKEQVFTGVVDTAGSQITGVKWLKGTNVEHADGVSVVDYDTGASHNMMVKGLLVQHKQSGAHAIVTADSLTTTGAVVAGTTLSVGTAISGAGYSLATMYNPYKFSAYRSAAWTSGSNAYAKIAFDTELFDTSNNFDTSSGRFVAPINGFYQLNWLAGATVVGGSLFVASLYKNGSLYRSGTAGVPESGATVPNRSGGGDLVQAAANDYFEVYFYGSGSAGQTGVTETYFSGHLVSAT